MTEEIVGSLAAGLLLPSIVLLLCKRLGQGLMFAIPGGSLETIHAIEVHDLGSALFSAGYTAIVVFLWWTRGGGKRRMREFLRKFVPVRRTAPVTGA